MTKGRACFFKKEGGTPSGPSAERALSFLIIHETKEGVKIIDDRPVIFVDGGCISGRI